MRSVEILLKFGIGGFLEKWQAFDPQPKRLPVNAENDLQRHQRVADGTPEKSRIGEGAVFSTYPTNESGLAVLDVVDMDFDAVMVGNANAEVEFGGQAGKGGDVEMFRGGKAKESWRFGGIDEVGLQFSKGVADFYDHLGWPAVGVGDEIETDRIEDVTEDTRQGDQSDAGVGRECAALRFQPGSEI